MQSMKSDSNDIKQSAAHVAAFISLNTEVELGCDILKLSHLYYLTNIYFSYIIIY